MKAKPRSRTKPKETRGRPEIPPSCRKVILSARVPRRILDGFKARAASQGSDFIGRRNSSLGLELERAYDATERPRP